MAILPKYPDLQVEILVDGKSATEYSDEEGRQCEPADNKITKYIEVLPSAAFGVKVSRQAFPNYIEPEQTLVVEVYLDGAKVDSVAWTSEKAQREQACSTTIDGLRSSNDGVNWKMQKFIFEALHVEEQGTLRTSAQNTEKLKHLGTIEVVLKRGIVTGKLKGTKPYEYKRAELGLLTEKSLKGRALDVRGGLDSPAPIAPLPLVYTSYRDKSPFATFVFKYMSRDALKKSMIIPRSPSPVPLNERPLESLTPQELRTLLAESRDRDARRARLKRELELDAVKQEGAKRHRSANPFTHGEVVSLLDEDEHDGDDDDDDVDVDVSVNVNSRTTNSAIPADTCTTGE